MGNTGKESDNKSRNRIPEKNIPVFRGSINILIILLYLCKDVKLMIR